DLRTAGAGDPAQRPMLKIVGVRVDDSIDRGVHAPSLCGYPLPYVLSIMDAAVVLSSPRLGAREVGGQRGNDEQPLTGEGMGSTPSRLNREKRVDGEGLR